MGYVSVAVIGLTPKQEKFCQNIIKGSTQRDAYKKSYDIKTMSDKTIDEAACRLMADSKIAARIERLYNNIELRNMATIENIVAELAAVAFVDATDFAKVEEADVFDGYELDEDGKPDESKPKTRKISVVNITDMNKIDQCKLRAIAGVKHGTNGIEIKLHDKIKALELMGKSLGMFVERVEHSGSVVQIVDNISKDKG